MGVTQMNLADTSKMRWFSLVVAVVVVECSGTPPVLFNFGDSNSDTGNVGVLMPQMLQNVDGHKTGRSCDGHLILDFLCESLNTSYISPYLDSLSGEDFHNGVNFALSASTASPQSYDPLSLQTQLLQYGYFYNRSLHLRSQGHKNMLGEEDFQNALYIIDIGQNDLKIWFEVSTSDLVLRKIQSFVTNIRHAMQSIYAHGGRKFWVHNTGPLGCLPGIVKRHKAGGEDEDVDEHGCMVPWNRAARAFNSKLSALCEELRLKLPGSTIVYVDVYAIKHKLMLNYSSYGIEQVCCSNNKGAKEKKKYVMWDDFHYSDAANSIVASMILSTNFSHPPLHPSHFFP